jgi:polysaccharide export outer membrane protein
VGKLKVEGLSKDQVRDTIKKSYEPYVKDPIVLVKFGNFKFYALGEFNRPGNISVEGERVNVLEAMALAGDMTQFAIRDNVKIIRDSNGHREVISLNFSDQSILNSPYSYLKRNDIIYARARGIKAVSSNFQRNAALIGSVTSLLAIILVFIRN